VGRRLASRQVRGFCTIYLHASPQVMPLARAPAKPQLPVPKTSRAANALQSIFTHFLVAPALSPQQALQSAHGRDVGCVMTRASSRFLRRALNSAPPPARTRWPPMTKPAAAGCRGSIIAIGARVLAGVAESK
jgi:hypothetical protein